MKTSREAYKKYYDKNKEDIVIYQEIYYIENRERLLRNAKIRRLKKLLNERKIDLDNNI